MKKLLVYSLTFILCLLLILNSTSFAASIKQYFSSGNTNPLPAFETVSSNIYVILKAVAIVAGACLLVFLAISYMLATPQKQAELKGRLGYYIGGIIFLFALGTFFDWFIFAAKNFVALL